MPDILEENQSQKENDQYDSAINTFRTKVPHLRDMEQPLKTVEQEVAEGVQTKISDLFSDYEDTPEKEHG